MRTEQEIQKKLKEIMNKINENLSEYSLEIKRHHPISANVHWEYHNMLLGWRDALQWVLNK